MSSSSCNLLKASEERPVERSSKNVNFLGRPGRPHSLPVGTPTSLSKSSGTVDIEGIQVTALFDSSNSESLICPKYQGFKLSVLRELCADLILGIDFQSQHSSVVFHYGGSEPPLSVDGLSTLKVDPPELFVNPTADCHKIASKSRRYSEEDQFCLHYWRSEKIAKKRHKRTKSLTMAGTGRSNYG